MDNYYSDENEAGGEIAYTLFLIYVISIFFVPESWFGIMLYGMLAALFICILIEFAVRALYNHFKKK